MTYEEANKIELVDVSSPGTNLKRLLVKQGRKEVGLLEKYPNTKTEQHPWKAFLGIGRFCKYLGSYPVKQDALDYILRADKGCFVGTAIINNK